MTQPEPNWIAIKRPFENYYTWYDLSIVSSEPNTYSSEENITSINYQPTGKVLINKDGRCAEIFEAKGGEYNAQGY